MSNVATLTLKGTSDLTKISTDLKSIATEAKNAGGPLNTVSSTVDKVSKSSTSLGSKLANAGKQFAGTITSVAALGGSIVNLNRQYQDLGDTQIKVDRTQLKVSKTAEAVRVAQDKLNKLTSTGVKSGAAYEKALLDVKQAQEAATLAVTMNGEALEDQQRAYENFFMGLAPTILTAGSTITSMFKEIGGEKGIGGLVSKLKGLGGLGGGIGGLGGLTSVLGPLAIAAGAAAVAMLAYNRAMEKAAAGKKELELAKSAKNLAEEIEHIKKAGEEFKLQPTKNPIDFLGSISGVGGITNAAIAWMTSAKIESAKAATETENLTKARERLAKANANPALTDYYSKEGNAARLEKQHAEEALKLAEAKEAQIPPTEKLTTTQAAANKALGETKSLLETMTTASLGGKSVFYSMAQNVDQLKASFVALNQEADRNQFMKLLSQGNLTAKTTSTPIPLFEQPNVDPNEWFSGAFEAGTIGFSNFAKDSADAAAKIKKDQEDAATAMKQAWDTAFTAQVSGIDKMIAAYDRLHPKEKGFSGLAQEKQFKDAQAQLDKLMSGAITKSPAFAKDFVTTFVTNVSKNMTPVAAQMFQPLIDYIAAHKNDAPEVFMKGFQEVLGKSNTTLGSAMAGILDKNMVQPTGVAAEKTTAALGTIKVPPAAIKSINTLTSAASKILPQYKPKITVIAPLQPVTLMKNAIAAVKSKTVTLSVKTTLQGQLSAALAKAIPNIPHAGGYSGTIRRPTMMLVGEGGREEDISVTPRGSTGHSGGGGGGDFYGTVNVYVDGVLRPARYSMGARK